MTIIGIWNAKRELYKIQRIENDENKWKQSIVLAEKLTAPVPVGLNIREKINAITQNIHIVLQTEMMLQACIFAAASAFFSFISVVLYLYLR